MNILFTALLLEALLAAFPWLMPVHSTQRLTRTGDDYWRLRPFLDAELSSACFQSRVRTNAWGTRDEPVEVLLARPEAWLFVGDSLVQGLEVDNDELFTSLLQKEFERFAIVNAGKSGSGPAEYHVFLQWYLAKRLHPRFTRAFVFFYLGNDFKNLVEAEYAALKGGTAAPAPTGAPPSWLQWLHRRRAWRAVELIVQNIEAWRYGERTFMEKEVVFIDSALFSEAARRLTGAFRHIKGLADGNGIAASVVTLPSVQNVVVGPEARSFTIPVAAARTAAADAGLPFIDLATELVVDARTRRLRFPYYSFTCDGHLSAFGHRRVAELLLRHLPR